MARTSVTRTKEEIDELLKELDYKKRDYTEFIAYMNTHNITQKEIGHVLGITTGDVNLKLNGKADFTVDEVRKLCQFYKISVVEYFIGTDTFFFEDEPHYPDGKTYWHLKRFMYLNKLENTQMAELLGINKATFSSKLCRRNGADFEDWEIRLICNTFNLDMNEYFSLPPLSEEDLPVPAWQKYGYYD